MTGRSEQEGHFLAKQLNGKDGTAVLSSTLEEFTWLSGELDQTAQPGNVGKLAVKRRMMLPWLYHEVLESGIEGRGERHGRGEIRPGRSGDAPKVSQGVHHDDCVCSLQLR